MKIKIIEFLNRIANGEYPKKIKYNGEIYEYKKIVQGTGYVTENYNWFDSDIHIDDWYNLNNEVEIIEEDKSIKELQFDSEEKYITTITGTTNKMRNIDVTLATKINELVKEIKKIKEN